ncbi:hypothetical protein AAEX28_07075 [Lentisphaerota bacterium WC36G]|nr:hypothetical protein LJT99_09940 [Lentisphaerae bacterium WC36]
MSIFQPQNNGDNFTIDAETWNLLLEVAEIHRNNKHNLLLVEEVDDEINANNNNIIDCYYQFTTLDQNNVCFEYSLVAIVNKALGYYGEDTSQDLVPSKVYVRRATIDDLRDSRTIIGVLQETVTKEKLSSQVCIAGISKINSDYSSFTKNDQLKFSIINSDNSSQSYCIINNKVASSTVLCEIVAEESEFSYKVNVYENGYDNEISAVELLILPTANRGYKLSAGQKILAHRSLIKVENIIELNSSEEQ